MTRQFQTLTCNAIICNEDLIDGSITTKAADELLGCGKTGDTTTAASRSGGCGRSLRLKTSSIRHIRQRHGCSQAAFVAFPVGRHLPSIKDALRKTDVL